MRLTEISGNTRNEVNSRLRRIWFHLLNYDLAIDNGETIPDNIASITKAAVESIKEDELNLMYWVAADRDIYYLYHRILERYSQSTLSRR